MKKIAIEEHFVPDGYADYLHTRTEYPKIDYCEEDGIRFERDWWSPTNYKLVGKVSGSDTPRRPMGFGEESRLKAMDEAGIDMQVLSGTANTTGFEASEGTSISKKSNDELARIIEKYPERFAGFASLAPQDPDAAARELERAVKELGLKGALTFGHIGEEFFDNRKYWPVLETAEKLNVPIYLHPGPPSPDMVKPYLDYPGLALALWGFTAEASLHAVRLICSGVFDKYPNLKIILGHMGETLPYMLWRLDSRWLGEKYSDDPATAAYKDFKKTPSQYFKDNFYVTTSGMFWPPVIQFACQVLGSDRVLFATDYPAESVKEAVEAIDSTPVNDEDKENIYHRNAERLLGL